jgi:hypothetical protein
MCLKEFDHESPRNQIAGFPNFFFVVLLGFLLTACGQKGSTDLRSDIIGTWTSGDGSYMLTFYPDGKMSSIVSLEGFQNETNSELIFVDDTHIMGVWEINLQAWEVQIRGDQMVLTGDDGRKIKLTRSK